MSERDRSVRFDAADGFKLAVQRFDVAEVTGDADALLRRDDVTALLKALPKTIASDADGITIAIGGIVGAVEITITHAIDPSLDHATPGQRYAYLAVSGTFPDCDRLIPRNLDGERDSTPRIALAPGHANAINKAATIGRGSDPIVKWYMPADERSPVVAIIGSDFVGVIMPMFVQWDHAKSETVIRSVLGEPAEPVPVAVEADAAS
jgi:hypothetical protein